MTLPAHLEADFARTTTEELEAVDTMVEGLLRGDFYEREIAALHAMGMHGNAKRLEERLAAQNSR